MAGSTLGTLLSVTTWGESHGRGIGVVIDGCPAGLSLAEQDIQKLREVAAASDLQTSFGANVLLGDINKAKQVFEKIDKETQEFIKEYPIYYLYASQS